MYVPPCMNKLEEGASELPKARRIVPHHGKPLQRSGPSSAKVAMMA
jgi:hypothetical protein